MSFRCYCYIQSVIRRSVWWTLHKTAWHRRAEPHRINNPCTCRNHTRQLHHTGKCLFSASCTSFIIIDISQIESLIHIINTLHYIIVVFSGAGAPAGNYVIQQQPGGQQRLLMMQPSQVMNGPPTPNTPTQNSAPVYSSPQRASPPGTTSDDSDDSVPSHHSQVIQ